jgi:hypothetical protein
MREGLDGNVKGETRQWLFQSKRALRLDSQRCGVCFRYVVSCNCTKKTFRRSRKEGANKKKSIAYALTDVAPIESSIFTSLVFVVVVASPPFLGRQCDRQRVCSGMLGPGSLHSEGLVSEPKIWQRGALVQLTVVSRGGGSNVAQVETDIFRGNPVEDAGSCGGRRRRRGRKRGRCGWGERQRRGREGNSHAHPALLIWK